MNEASMDHRLTIEGLRKYGFVRFAGRHADALGNVSLLGYFAIFNGRKERLDPIERSAEHLLGFKYGLDTGSGKLFLLVAESPRLGKSRNLDGLIDKHCFSA